MDLFTGPSDPNPNTQIVDLNPGIEDNGLFWIARVPDDFVEANPTAGRAHMEGEVDLEDYHDIVNALLDGPSAEATASVHIDWTKSSDKHHFHYDVDRFDANLVFNSARVEWSAESDKASYVSDPSAALTVLHAQVGEERNGAFFN